MEPYIPDELPLNNLDYTRLFGLVGQANAELARYDGLLQGIINPAILLSPITTQEAVLSSKIEGTQATVDEVLEHEAGLEKEGEKSKDIQEIVNYRQALMSARAYVQDRPLTLFVIRELHKILLDSVRGHNKTPGEFRKDQNWIGKVGSSLEQATFVPPSPLQLQDYLENWQNYLAFDDKDHLLQLAVVHAQFEIIHPFLDGNGRIGRILIPLFLYQKGKLSQPMFYLSSYLEKHQEIYYQRLQSITQEHDWNSWIEFFLNAIVVQAKENCTRVQRIMNLYQEMKSSVTKLTRSQNAIQILDALFDKPIFQTIDFVKRTKMPKQTAMPLLKRLRDEGIIKILREPSGPKAGVMAFSKLLNLAEGKNIL